MDKKKREQMFAIKKGAERKKQSKNQIPINIGIFTTGGENNGITNGRNECDRNDYVASMDLD